MFNAFNISQSSKLYSLILGRIPSDEQTRISIGWDNFFNNISTLDLLMFTIRSLLVFSKAFRPCNFEWELENGSMYADFTSTLKKFKSYFR